MSELYFVAKSGSIDRPYIRLPIRDGALDWHGMFLNIVGGFSCAILTDDSDVFVSESPQIRFQCPL